MYRNFSNESIIFGAEKKGIGSLFINLVKILPSDQQNRLRNILSGMNTFWNILALTKRFTTLLISGRDLRLYYKWNFEQKLTSEVRVPLEFWINILAFFAFSFMNNLKYLLRKRVLNGLLRLLGK